MASPSDSGVTFRTSVNRPVDRYASVAEQREKETRNQQIAAAYTSQQQANTQRFGQHTRTEREQRTERYQTERTNDKSNDRPASSSSPRYEPNRGGKKQYGFNNDQSTESQSNSQSYQSNNSERRGNYGRSNYNDRNDRNADRTDRNDRYNDRSDRTSDRSDRREPQTERSDRYTPHSRSPPSTESYQPDQRRERAARPAPSNLPDLDALQLNDPNRPKLKLAPRGSTTQPASSPTASSPSAGKPNPFGAAKPREENIAKPE